MKSMSLTTKILIGLVLGVIVGLILPDAPLLTNIAKPCGTIFLNLIKMVIVPLVFCSLVVGTASLNDIRKLGRIGGKTLVYFLGTTALAITLGLILGNIIKPGVGLTLPVDATYTPPAGKSLADVLVALFPSNPIQSMVNADMMQIIVFSLFVGIGIGFIGEKGKIVNDFFDGFAEVTYKIVGMIMQVAPIGVFCLILPVVQANGPGVLLPLGKVIGNCYLGYALHFIIVYGLAVKTLGNMNPMTFFRGFAPASIFAFTTCSSSGTLPVSMKCAQENLGVSKEVSAFVQPLGATINMDGTALFQGVCALFIAQVYGIDLTINQQLMIILMATLASIGTAGVPGAGSIMLVMVLQGIGLPLEGMALILGIDRILDMGRTCLNVTGDASAAVIVEYGEQKYYAKHGKVSA